MTPGQELAQSARERVTRLADADDPDLRALALATLDAAGEGVNPAGAVGESNAFAVTRRRVMILGYLADQALTRGDVAEAEALLHRARTVAPDDAEVPRALGLLYSGAGDYERAIAAFAESLAADSLQPLVHVNLGIARAATGDVEGAMRDYAAALALNPEEALAHFNLGNLYLRQGQEGAAVPSYERSVLYGPELGSAHRNLAIALARTGRVEEAIPHARRAVELAPPGDRTASDVLAQLEAALSNRE